MSHSILSSEPELVNRTDASVESASTPALALSGELFDTHLAPVGRYLERHYGEIDGPQTALDTLIEVADYAVRKPIQCVRALVMCVAKRKANRARERARREESHSEPQEAVLAPCAEDLSERLALQMALREALRSLSDEDRALFLAHYVEEYELAEIAAHFRLTVSAVKSRLFRARRLLKSHPGLAEYCPEKEKGGSGHVGA
jgi:RNA polymerase sigma factor (sigma-70 family)